MFPQKPFFNRKRLSGSTDDTVSKKPHTSGTFSGQRITIRSDQLKSQELIDFGAIDREMFDELQHTP